MRVSRPNTLDSTALEVGGSVPVLGAEIRSADSDMRHLVSFLVDVSDYDQCHKFFMETRWSDSFQILFAQLYPRYAVGFGKFLFRVYGVTTIGRTIDSHVSQKELLEIRQKSGVNAKYNDFEVPALFNRFKNQKAGTFDVMKETDKKPETRIQKLQKRMLMTQELLNGVSKLKNPYV